MNIVDRPDIANNAHASTLIGAGLTSYFLNESRPKTALIPPVAGGALLLMSPSLKKGDKTIAHVAVGVTTLLAVMTGTLLSKTLADAKKEQPKFTPEKRQRRASVFGLMTLTGIAAISVYVTGFVEKRKQQEG
ncbi:hypothetical protein CLV24_11047 [Pontibacter ummariensis]|uniref:Uncharacterized protein n=1 Tax=Pontibacter ummariensis TaxID=1610492 RepID=A0A239G7P1_9BACT|nr:hypothetical protein [Pontibacter ummariensis]PRY11602.1 hypothetical protein CLV24_11047 [Pontibacter ummariensis]SNS65129.1 hypothetical protein SAMN06296052_110101 [Pontibacter ummariensis]